MLLTLTQFSYAQLIWSYDFKNDTVGKQLAGNNGWSSTNATAYPGIGDCAGATCDRAQVKRDTLEYANYGSFYKALDILRADGVGHFLNNTNKLPDSSAAPVYKDGDKVYAAFLIKVKTAPVAGSGSASSNQLVRLYGRGKFGDGVGMRIYCNRDDASALRFGIEKFTGVQYTDFKYALNKTHLIVMRYTYKDSLNTNDQLALFVNPNLKAGEPTTPDAVSGNGDDVNLNRFVFYFNNFSEIATGSITGVKVYRSWNDVVSSTVETRNDVLSIRPTLAESFVELNLDKPYPSVSYIKVVDLQGREVLMDKINAGEQRKTLNINNLAKGFYVVSIQNKDFIAAQKFVKN